MKKRLLFAGLLLGSIAVSAFDYSWSFQNTKVVIPAETQKNWQNVPAPDGWGFIDRKDRKNLVVKTKDGIGTVVYNDILKEKINVKFVSDDSVKIVTYEIDEVKPVIDDTKNNDQNNRKDKGNIL